MFFKNQEKTFLRLIFFKNSRKKLKNSRKKLNLSDFRYSPSIQTGVKKMPALSTIYVLSVWDGEGRKKLYSTSLNLSIF